MSIDVMKQALEVLENVVAAHGYNGGTPINAITALRAAIEQAQEPVAWMYVNTDGECEQIEYETPPDDPSITPLYTAPRKWQGLTDEEIKIIWRDIDGSEGMLMRFARAIEAKLKEKNT